MEIGAEWNLIHFIKIEEEESDETFDVKIYIDQTIRIKF